MSSPTTGQHEKQKSRQPNVSSKSGHFEYAVLNIVWATSLVVLPMLILSIIFIVLVYIRRVPIPSVSSENNLFSDGLSLVNNSGNVRSAFFIDYDSTRLLTVASWTSTVVTFLPSWIMLLISYKLGALLLDSPIERSPTPFQFQLLLKLCTASYASLWSWLTYRFGRHRETRANSIVESAVLILCLCSGLGLLIILGDTWLHLVTTTVIVQENVQITSDFSNFSRTLKAECLSGDGQVCTITVPDNRQDTGTIANATIAYQTLLNISTNGRVLSTNFDDQVYSFYAPAQTPANATYRASSYAMNTFCTTISNACSLSQERRCGTGTGCPGSPSLSTYLPFNCSSALSGDLTSLGTLSNPAFATSSGGGTNFFIMYFNDSQLTQFYNPQYDLEHNTWETYFVKQKPSHFAVGAIVPANPALITKGDLVKYDITDTAAFLLGCSSQILELQYTYSSDGTISDPVVAPASDKAIASITGPILFEGTQAWDSVVVGLRTAALQSSLDDLTASFAQTYSHTILSMGVGAVEPTPALQQSTTITKPLARMPKAPFFTLIALNTLYCILGITLASLAVVSGPNKVRPIQARLSTEAVVAALFEGERADGNVTKIEDLFEETASCTDQSTAEGTAASTGSHMPSTKSRKRGYTGRVVVVPTQQRGWRFERMTIDNAHQTNDITSQQTNRSTTQQAQSPQPTTIPTATTTTTTTAAAAPPTTTSPSSTHISSIATEPSRNPTLNVTPNATTAPTISIPTSTMPHSPQTSPVSPVSPRSNSSFRPAAP